VSTFKLKTLNIDIPPFRKLKNIKLEFADRVTLIAGHNGIGKSTILALIANGSGLTGEDFRTYSAKKFTGHLNEIIYLDYDTEFKSKKIEKQLPRPILKYSLDGHDFEKRCALTKRTIPATKNNLERLEVRVVPRNSPLSDYTIPGTDIVIGGSSKVPLPTIYLGMTRMLPIGESDPDLIENTPDDTIHEEDADFIIRFVNGVIGIAAVNGDKNIVTQGIKGTTKNSKHPVYSHSAKTVSLGQDSLSSIATALASFQKLKREWGECYPGGLLVIDEIDAGFHPHAQGKLIKSIISAARRLQLQVVATTHSLPLIESMYPDARAAANQGAELDKVIYIRDTRNPIASHLTLEEIKNDMHLIPPKKKQVKKTTHIKVYLEDAEADLFLKCILTRRLQTKVKEACGFRLKSIPISLGCDNLQGLQRFDPHFKKVIIVLDADAKLKKGIRNIAKLPGGKDSLGNGFNPERTIYEFVNGLVNDSEAHPDSWKSLNKLLVTTDMLEEYLLNGDFDIKKREPAKRWMRSRLKYINDWNLVGLWLHENSDSVKAFENALIKAATVTAKLN
jgi:ABC-type multidrug transport system ATPase subunit